MLRYSDSRSRRDARASCHAIRGCGKAGKVVLVPGAAEGGIATHSTGLTCHLNIGAHCDGRLAHLPGPFDCDMIADLWSTDRLEAPCRDARDDASRGFKPLRPARAGGGNAKKTDSGWESNPPHLALSLMTPPPALAISSELVPPLH